MRVPTQSHANRPISVTCHNAHHNCSSSNYRTSGRWKCLIYAGRLTWTYWVRNLTNTSKKWSTVNSNLEYLDHETLAKTIAEQNNLNVHFTSILAGFFSKIDDNISFVNEWNTAECCLSLWRVNVLIVLLFVILVWHTTISTSRCWLPWQPFSRQMSLFASCPTRHHSPTCWHFLHRRIKIRLYER